MPVSDSHGKVEAVEWMTTILTKPKSLRVLDVGCGDGRWSRLVRWLCERIVAVEVWAPYVERFKLIDLYDAVEIADVRHFIWSTHGSWDVVIFGDVLEHMPQLDAVGVVARALRCSRYVLVSVPLGVYEQGEVDGNPYERHLSTWTHTDVLAAWPTAKRLDPYDESRPDDTVVGVYVLGANGAEGAESGR